jgi:threonine synthase
VRVVRETGGYCEEVTELEIAIAKAEIGREGIGCEPASAVTLAGLKKLVADGRVQKQESVILLLTGHTLKDADYTIDFHRGQLLHDGEKAGHEAEVLRHERKNIVVDATPEAVMRALETEAMR